MVRGYSKEEVREGLISALDGKESGMSGVEIARHLGINRITMAKYLKVFAAENLLHAREIGNVTLWHLSPGQESYTFPDDYFRITSLYEECLAGGSEEQILSLVRNCMDSGASARRLILEVILPAIHHVSNMFDAGKIGTAEQSLMATTISRSLHVLCQTPPVADPMRNAVVISADPQSSLVSEAASAAYRSDGWRVYHLGDMSSAINVLFDLDFEKLISRVWRQRQGIIVIAVFSDTREGLSFFADSVNPIRKKSGRRMKLVLCGEAPGSTEADLLSERLEDILQWSQTVSGSS